MSKRPLSRSGPFRTVEKRSIGRERKEHFFCCLDFCTNRTPSSLLQAGEFADLFCREEIEVHIFHCFSHQIFSPPLKVQVPNCVRVAEPDPRAARNCSQAFFFQEQAKQDQKAGTETGHWDDTIIGTGIDRVHKPSSLFSDVWVCLWVFSRLYLPILQAF